MESHTIPSAYHRGSPEKVMIASCTHADPPSQTERLADVLESVEKSLAFMESRLAPVLQPSVPMACSPKSPGPPISRLGVLVDRCGDIRHYIDDLAARVDA